MKKYIFAGVSILLISSFIYAGEGDYAVSKIQATLLKNANVVKRMEEERFSLKNPGEAFYYHKYAITILNENGDDHAFFFQYYDKFSEIKSIEGVLYDASGKEIKRLKNKDIQDLSGVSDMSLMEDDRRKVHSFYYKSYPYTVEYSLELKYNGTMFYPVWQPAEATLFSVEQSRFVFECPSGYEFRYKAFQYEGEPFKEEFNGRKKFTWEIKNLPAIIREPYSPEFSNLTTKVLFGPTEFEMQGYKGNMKSWQDFGKFVYTLKQGRDQLPPEIKQKVHQLTDGITDPKEKIKVLYEFMQKNTRYVSIQLGIGGWQPFDAKYVATKGYGDCKALTNYMYSMLKEIGLPSFYALVKAGTGRKSFVTDFPFSQFNHVILFVPLQKDSIWLECTSQIESAGFLGSHTDERFTLVVDENGGQLVQTPKYGSRENKQERTVRAILDPEGNLDAEISTIYSSLRQELPQALVNYLSKDKVKEYLDRELDFATYTVNSFKYTESKSAFPSVDEKLNVSVDHYATISGKRLFVVPNVITRFNRKLRGEEERRYDIILDMAFTDVDNVEIAIPAGYKTESTPQDLTLDTKFGRYRSSVQLKENKIIYTRTLEHTSGKFPKSDYNELLKFYDAIFKADRNKIVLVKNEEEKKPF